jgi:hypothetical protein
MILNGVAVGIALGDGLGVGLGVLVGIGVKPHPAVTMGPGAVCPAIRYVPSGGVSLDER